MNSVEANTGYSSAYIRIAYTQTLAVRPHTPEKRRRKHALFVRIRTNSIDANSGYASAFARIAYTETQVLRQHPHE